MSFQITSNKYLVGPWVAEHIKGMFHSYSSTAIGLANGNDVRAGVIYENWNKASITCHIAVTGRLTRQFLFAIFDYPFRVMGVRKIIAPIAESNARSIKFVEKLGFRKEAQLLDAHPDGSLLLYTMSPGACRFIGDKYGQREQRPSST